MNNRVNRRPHLLLLWVVCSCASAQTMTVEFDATAEAQLSPLEKSVINQIAQDTDVEVRALLPQMPRDVKVTVSVGTDVIPETGTGAASLEPGHIVWIVDASRPEGVVEIARSNLRSALFHEMHHLARGWVITGGAPVTTIMDAVVSEGMATVFERDFADSEPLWGSYPDNIEEWVEELLALPASALGLYEQWIFQHPDGRRWIGYRSGTFIVDRAVAKSGMSAAELVLTSTDEVLDLAGLDEL